MGVPSLAKIAPHLRQEERVDKEVIQALWSICEDLRSNWKFYQVALRQYPSITPQDLIKLEQWINAISYAIHRLLSGDDLQSALSLYKEIEVSDQVPEEERFAVKKLKLVQGKFTDITNGKPVGIDDVGDLAVINDPLSPMGSLADRMTDQGVFVRGSVFVYIIDEFFTEDAEWWFRAISFRDMFARSVPGKWSSQAEALEAVRAYDKEFNEGWGIE